MLAAGAEWGLFVLVFFYGLFISSLPSFLSPSFLVMA